MSQIIVKSTTHSSRSGLNTALMLLKYPKEIWKGRSGSKYIYFHNFIKEIMSSLYKKVISSSHNNTKEGVKNINLSLSRPQRRYCIYFIVKISFFAVKRTVPQCFLTPFQYKAVYHCINNKLSDEIWCIFLINCAENLSRLCFPLKQDYIKLTDEGTGASGPAEATLNVCLAELIWSLKSLQNPDGWHFLSLSLFWSSLLHFTKNPRNIPRSDCAVVLLKEFSLNTF